jgi:hypothetical protein
MTYFLLRIVNKYATAPIASKEIDSGSGKGVPLAKTGNENKERAITDIK